jgi:hypothetical protein
MAATTAAVIGIASTLTTTGLSFRQAAKQSRLEKKALSEAAKAEADARKRLTKNTMAGLDIQKEPYELQREALLSTGAQALEAGRESDRGLSAVTGRVLEQQRAAQGDVRTAMGQEMTQNILRERQEEGRLADIGMGLELEKLSGAQLAARDAGLAGKKAMQEGFQGLKSAAGQIAAQVPLFMETRGDRAAQKAFDFASETGVTDVQKVAAATPGLEATKSMTPEQFKTFLREDSKRGELLLQSLQTQGGLGVKPDQDILSQSTNPFEIFPY